MLCLGVATWTPGVRARNVGHCAPISTIQACPMKKKARNRRRAARLKGR